MPTLNLQQTELGPERYRVSVSSDLPNLTLQHANISVGIYEVK